MHENFENYMKENGLSDNTCECYSRDLKLFEKYYFDSYGEDLTQLIHSDIIEYRNYLNKHGISPKTINKKIAALKQYNLFLVKENIQNDIVIIDKDYIKIQNSIIPKKLPTNLEINRIKHFACKDDKNPKRDMCIVSIFTYGGLRVSELINIKITDIKLEQRFINIIGKGNKFRQIIINDVMYEAIKDYLQERADMNIINPYLIIGQKNKNNNLPVSRKFCNDLLDKYSGMIKSVKLHPHLLRSFFCTNALHNAGYSIEQVANQAGHCSLNTTKMYLVSEQEDLLTLANKM